MRFVSTGVKVQIFRIEIFPLQSKIGVCLSLHHHRPTPHIPFVYSDFCSSCSLCYWPRILISKVLFHCRALKLYIFLFFNISFASMQPFDGVFYVRLPNLRYICTYDTIIYRAHNCKMFEHVWLMWLRVQSACNFVGITQITFSSKSIFSFIGFLAFLYYLLDDDAV